MINRIYLILFLVLFGCSKQNTIQESITVSSQTKELTEIKETTSTITENTNLNIKYLDATNASSIEGAAVEFLTFTTSKVTDITNNYERNLTVVALQKDNYIYKLDYENLRLERLLKFTDNPDLTDAPEAGVVKVLIIENQFLLVAYNNNNFESIIKQFDLNDIAESGTVIYSSKNIQNVHPCLDMVYDSETSILYFCKGDSTMQHDEITQQLHLPDGKIHRFKFSKETGLEPIKVDINIYDYLEAYPNSYPNYLPSIFAIGLRNPWELHLSENSLLYIPDVGDGKFEELNIIDLKQQTYDNFINFGWPIYNGTEINDLKRLQNDFLLSDEKLEEFMQNKIVHTSPILQYEHYTDSPRGQKCAIIGGATYKNVDSNFWNNKYFFGDYCSSELFTIYGKFPNFNVYFLTQLEDFITYIGNDLNGKILIATEHFDEEGINKGKIYKLILP